MIRTSTVVATIGSVFLMSCRYCWILITSYPIRCQNGFLKIDVFLKRIIETKVVGLHINEMVNIFNLFLKSPKSLLVIKFVPSIVVLTIVIINLCLR